MEGNVAAIRRPTAPRARDQTDVRIIDFVDTGHPALLRMWDKRHIGYRAMGYRVSHGDGDAAD